MERTWKTVHFPGYVYGDNAVPPVPSSFRNVPLRAERIRHLNNRMRRKQVVLLAFLSLASLRAVKFKLSALYCGLRADQPSSDVWRSGRMSSVLPNELNSSRHSHSIIQRYMFEVIYLFFFFFFFFKEKPKHVRMGVLTSELISFCQVGNVLGC